MDGLNTNMAGRLAGRRSWGSGSIYAVKGGRYWRVSVSVGTDGKSRRRREWQFANRADAERKLRHVQADLERGLPPDEVFRVSEIKTHVKARLSAADATRLILARARDKGWSDDFTAQAIAAGLSSMRLRLGVTGPCAYCGDELASTVDHVDPDGGDEPDNLASACGSCNTSKGHRTPQQWRAA